MGTTKSWYCTYLESSGTGDRDDVFSLSQHPGQSDLSGSGIVFLADLLQTVRELKYVWEVLLRVPRDKLAEVTILEVVRRFLWRNSMGYPTAAQQLITHIAAGEQAPSEGRIRNDLHAEFSRSPQKSDGLPLDV